MAGVSVTDVVNCNTSIGGITMPNQFTEHSMSHLQVPTVCGVYMLIDNISGNTYIGGSTNIRMRIFQHFSEIKTHRRNIATYTQFRNTFSEYGTREFSVRVLLICEESELYEYEIKAIAVYKPTENSYIREDRRLAYSVKERDLRSERVKALWATPEYRERAVAARKGKAYNKGYKCTPEQTENRRKAARISNMKRNYGERWVEEYTRRYPEHAEEVSGS